MILRAAETARSLLEPTTKLSRVYLWLRPVLLKLDFELVVVLRIVRTRSLMTDSLLVISRERILVLALFWTSKSRLATGRLLFSRDFLMISEYRLRSCLTKKVFLTPIIMFPSLVDISDVSWNHVEKLAADICCSISASAFFQTSYIDKNLLRMNYYSMEVCGFPQVLVVNYNVL